MNVALVRKGSTEGPWALPEGWCWSLLSDVAFVNPATSFDHLAASDSITFVPMAAVAEETGTIDLSIERPMKEVAKGYVRFAEGDVIFAKITPCMENGKVAPVPTLRQGVAAGSTEFHVLRPLAVEQRYLWYWLVGRTFRGRAQRNMSGSAGQLHVPVTYLRESEVPVPPLAEQRRIVARIDALFEEIAEGERALDAARKSMETYRRALLKAAVTGELTADWRNAVIPEVTGADVLKRIRAAAEGQVGSHGHRRRTLSESVIDPTLLPLLPDEWTWARLGEIGELVGGVTVDAKRRPSDPVTVPYLRVANVQRGWIDLTIVKSLTLEKSVAEKLTLQAGDVLLNEGGDRDKIGRGWVWESQVPGMVHQNHVFRVRLLDEGLNPFFVSHYTNEMGRSYFLERGKQTTNLASISMTKVSEIPVPIPPPSEAKEILRRVADGLAAASDTQHVLDAEASDVQRLRQSVLKAAFEGRLVPQDKSDEPAPVMLARIAASQAEAPRPRRGRPSVVTP